MPVTPTYPGVYVQEVPSGVRTIAGVSTSIAMFIGAAKKGPLFQPVRCTNYTDFVRAFSADTSAGQLPNYVKLFFLNGGTDCYVMRIASGAASSQVTLKNEGSSAVSVLRLTAKDAGLAGENIRAVVNYKTPQPEATFNLDLFRWAVDSAGNRTKNDTESWKGLTMDPASPLYAPAFITQNSKLVSALPGSAMPTVGSGLSLSGRAVSTATASDADFRAAWQPLFGNNTSVIAKYFMISIGGSPYVQVDLSSIPVGASSQTKAQTQTAVETAIQKSLAATMPTVDVHVTFPEFPAGTPTFTRMQVTSSSGDVFIRPAAQYDLAVPLMLGTDQGGLEVSRYAAHRPAPTGITMRPSDNLINTLANLKQTSLSTAFIKLPSVDNSGTPTARKVTLTLGTTTGADPVSKDNYSPSPNENSDGIREKLALIAGAVNTFAPPADSWPWKADVWGYRLAVLPTDATGDNFYYSGFGADNPTAAASTTNNVHNYSLGAGGAGVGGFQTSGATGSDGVSPGSGEYEDAYTTIDKEVDLFNLMVLPPPAAVAMTGLYGRASVFCQQRRAFLLMDPPPGWTDAQSASTGVANLRVGLVKDYSAVFFPNLTIDEGGLKKNIGPSGAIAGLCARTDGTRGVWKAPAGTDADLRGVIGLEQRFSDGENGILNPRAVNTIRIFPNGIVNWGARTMDGDNDFGSEYKYIPIRRLALYMEESLYRGLKWVVFEPNDEPLWAQVRLNVGAFMHNLFRQGAFQGATPKDAYFVKCDKETTTQNDRNLGIVNIWVGFAPLKPAEFVILYLQQMAGQIEV